MIRWGVGEVESIPPLQAARVSAMKASGVFLNMRGGSCLGVVITGQLPASVAGNQGKHTTTNRAHRTTVYLLNRPGFAARSAKLARTEACFMEQHASGTERE
jgi:hypothetical protein